jgi:uncharacterized SAM-binding protein YcdF (DUF218 family)
MFMLKKLITPFLLPPGIFILALIALGGWYLRKKEFRTGLGYLVIGSLLWVCSMAPVSDTIVRGLETGLHIPADPQGDVIVMLGAGSYNGVEDLSGKGAPLEDALARIVTAARLYKRLQVPVIISGGTSDPRVVPEAVIDQRFLVDLGVPQNRILIEDRSRDTHDNALFTKAICEREGFTRPLVVTSAYHMKRSLLLFRKVRLDATGVPAQFKTGPDMRYGWRDYLPGDMRDMNLAVKEYLGLIFYTIF